MPFATISKWFFWGTKFRTAEDPLPAKNKGREGQSRRIMIELFLENYSDRLDHFFTNHPEVKWWYGTKEDLVTVVTCLGKRNHIHTSGRLILDDSGEVTAWESHDKTLKFESVDVSLNEKVMADQISARLKDDEQARKYCDMFAASLLENPEGCVFSALEALHCKVKKFQEEFYSESWENAWINALMAEFQASNVKKLDKPGLFRLEAI